MVKRFEYKPDRSSIISSKNEPLPFKYPNMYEAYQAFSETYKISKDNFILTNGCENAFKIALLALKVKYIEIENPGWYLADVICEGLDVRYKYLNYEYKDKEFKINEKPGAKFIYTTDTYNSMFEHTNLKPSEEYTTILDETYTLEILCDEERIIKDNVITIGSFSKFVDPGLRIGYIIFPKKYKDKFNLLREEYISREACEYICKKKKINNKKEISLDYRILNHIISANHVYLTLDIEPNTFLPYAEFEVSGKTFYKIGYNKNIGEILCKSDNV